MNTRTIAVVATATLMLTLAVGAEAHVTLQPSTAPAGGFVRLDVRVPNEQDAENTTRVEVQMPPGFSDASYEPVPGWKETETRHKLAEPIKADDGDLLTDELSTITFTAAAGKGIEPGQFQDFGLSLALPDKPGTKLTFKALQTYAGGEVVRWIGAPGSEKPAPQVALMAVDQAPTAPATGAASATGGSSDDDDGRGNGLAIVALVVGALGLVVGGVGLATARRASAGSA